jgi:hypothetical protein
MDMSGCAPIWPLGSVTVSHTSVIERDGGVPPVAPEIIDLFFPAKHAGVQSVGGCGFASIATGSEQNQRRTP